MSASRSKSAAFPYDIWFPAGGDSFCQGSLLKCNLSTNRCSDGDREMQILGLEHVRGSLARGLARQAMKQASLHSADDTRLVSELHDLAPNARSHMRYARRLRRRVGVVRVRPTDDGLLVIFRNTVSAILRKDDVECYAEQRISWTSIHAMPGRRLIRFTTYQVQIGIHAIQRKIERSACPLDDLLGQMDCAMVRALGWLDDNEPIRDRDDAYLPCADGVWAGGMDEVQSDPAWGRAFAGDARPLPVFAAHTYLGEEQMRPTVWLSWSQAMGGHRDADQLRVEQSAA
jgi:hypothetical protein